MAGHEVRITAEGGAFAAYVAAPTAPPKAGLIVIQEHLA